MTRIALIAGLAGTVALALSAFSAEAAYRPTGPASVHAGNASIVQQARFTRNHQRHYQRHHRPHWYRFWR